MPQHTTPGSLLGKIAAYTELLAKDPYSTIFVPLSDAYRQMDMLDEAVAVAQQGIMDNPAFAAGYVALGNAFVAQGLEDQAIGEFEKSLILDHRHLPALKELAKMKMARQDSAAARELLERAGAVKGNDPEILKLLAAVEKPPSAPAAPLTAPSPPPPVPAAAPSFVIDEAPESAAEVSGAGKAVEPIATATLAEIYIRQGLPQKALKVFRDLLKVEPHNDQLRRKLIQLKQHIDVQEVPALEAETLLAAEQDESVSAVEEVTAVQLFSTAVEVCGEPPAEGVLLSVETETVLTLTAEVSGDAVGESAAPRSERSVPEVLSAWLNAIHRRRAAHV